MALENLDSLDNLDQATTVGVAANEEKKQHIAALEAAMAETIKANGAEIVSTFGKAADTISVEKVLCYTDKGNIIEVEKAQGKRYLTEEVPSKTTPGKTIVRVKKDDNGQPIKNPNYVPHVVKDSPKNVGFIIKNNGTAAIEYVTSECTKGADGQYVVTKKNASLAPGQAAPIRKTDLTALLAAPAFSFRAANGKFTPKAGCSAANITLAERLECYTFSFAEGSINDRQEQIGEKDANGKWFVRDEYKSLFGDEENVVATEKKAVVRTKKEKIDGITLEANYIYSLIAKEGV